MNTVKSVHILALLAFLLSSAVCVATADAQTVHALLIIMDADPKIGRNVKIDQKRMQQLLDAIHNDFSEVETVTLLSSEGTATRNRVLRWVQNINVAENDIVFIYYAGHGGMNPNRQTFLATEGKWLFRSELVNAIKQVKSHRLTLLITDCCSNLVQTKVEPTLQSSRSLTRLTERVLRNLFLEHKGFFHVTAATEGQYGWSNNVTGGWFTRNFIEALDGNPDKDKDGFLTWKEVFETARENTEKTFRQTIFTSQQQADMKRLGITSQTPKAYSFPTPLGGANSKTEERKTANYIFLGIVLGTLGIATRVSRRLKRHGANNRHLNFHRGKVFAIFAIETLMWLGFNIFTEFFMTNWMFIGIIGIFIILMILARKRKRYV